ncbi:SWI/SNF-related matrix-associated actin-dependent regulator of chromatin subfamily E member 1-like isoform X2 [Artemia franciscana]|uniref:SWI/SNF-related matrix-associated actin-dependent regulator of chromatin subfamily E member 1-like isoform X2 n=1 Tax=Artemia franciscana TaxID=6661 RepID=UPI0032DAA611
MELDKEEKSPARQGWSPDELQRLYNKVKDIANKTKRVTSWDKFLRDHFPWDEIEIKNRNKDETKAVLMELLDKRHVRHYRLLNELMDDLAEKAEKNLPPFIPDPPKKPLSTYMLYSMSKQKKIRRENPDLDMGAIGKIVGELYQQIPDKKRKKLGEQHQLLMDKYHQDFEEYLTKYPQMAPVLCGEGKKEAQQRVGQKDILSAEEKSHYEEMYKERLKKYEQELAEFREKHPEIAAEMDTKKKPTKKEAKQKKKSVAKEVLASDFEDSDLAQPKSKKSKSTVTLNEMDPDVLETKSKRTKLKSNGSEDEKRATKKKQIGKKKMNGKVPKRKESGSNDSEDDEPEIKPVKEAKRKVLEKKQLDLSDLDSEELREVTEGAEETKKKQNKKLIVFSKADDSGSDTEEPIPKTLSRKLSLEPPMLDSSDEKDEETNVAEPSAAKAGKFNRTNKPVKLQSKKDLSSESENERESPKTDLSKTESDSDSDNTTPVLPSLKLKKNEGGNLGGKVQRTQKSYLSLNEMKTLDYNELTNALKKSVPGYPVQDSLGALDVFMEIYPTRDLEKARKKFQRLQPKEQEEIFLMYRQKKDDFQNRMKEFYAGLDQEEKRFFKLAIPIIREKINMISSEHSVEGQSEDED